LTLGVAYLRSGQMQDAQRELEKATELEPNNAVAHYQLGRLYKEIHDPEHAKAEFDRTAELHDKAVSQTPKSPESANPKSAAPDR
jgi:Tfp pilus assembly protein PilF